MKRCRPIIQPNVGFFKQLVAFEKELFGGKSSEEEIKKMGLLEQSPEQKSRNLKMVLGQVLKRKE